MRFVTYWACDSQHCAPAGGEPRGSERSPGWRLQDGDSSAGCTLSLGSAQGPHPRPDSPGDTAGTGQEQVLAASSHFFPDITINPSLSHSWCVLQDVLSSPQTPPAGPGCPMQLPWGTQQGSGSTTAQCQGAMQLQPLPHSSSNTGCR